MPEYGVSTSRLTRVTRTPGTGRMPKLFSTWTCACPPPTSTRSCCIVPPCRITAICPAACLEAIACQSRAEAHIGQHGRLEEAVALRGALAAGDDFGILLDRVGDVRLDLLDRLHGDQWPDHRTRLEPVGD